RHHARFCTLLAFGHGFAERTLGMAYTSRRRLRLLLVPACATGVAGGSASAEERCQAIDVNAPDQAADPAEPTKDHDPSLVKRIVLSTEHHVISLKRRALSLIDSDRKGCQAASFAKRSD